MTIISYSIDLNSTDGESEGGDPEELIPWTVIVNKRHNGTLACLKPNEKQCLKESIEGFLQSKTGKLPKTLSKGRQELAFPRKFVKEFNDFLDDEIEKGLFKKSPKRKKLIVRRPIKQDVCYLLLAHFIVNGSGS